jgi:hypothetical protein
MSKDQNTKDVDDWLLHLCKSRSCMPREDSSFTDGQFQNHLQNELSGHGIRLDTVTHDKNVPEVVHIFARCSRAARGIEFDND